MKFYWGLVARRGPVALFVRPGGWLLVAVLVLALVWKGCV